jgi:hypothetical protein
MGSSESRLNYQDDVVLVNGQGLSCYIRIVKVATQNLTIVCLHELQAGWPAALFTMSQQQN